MNPAAGRAALGSLFLLAAQPCLAAEDIRETAGASRESAAFAGANLRLELGRSGRPRPTARFQLGMTHRYRHAGSAVPAQGQRFAGLELGASAKGQPTFFVGGQEVRGLEQRLGVKGTTGTILIVGGIVLVAAVVLAMSSGGQLGPCTGGPGC